MSIWGPTWVGIDSLKLSQSRLCILHRDSLVEPSDPAIGMKKGQGVGRSDYLVYWYGWYRVQKHDGYRLKKYTFLVQVWQNSDFKYMIDRTSTLVQAASSLITRVLIGWHCMVLNWARLVSESGDLAEHSISWSSSFTLPSIRSSRLNMYLSEMWNFYFSR